MVLHPAGWNLTLLIYVWKAQNCCWSLYKDLNFGYSSSFRTLFFSRLRDQLLPKHLIVFWIDSFIPFRLEFHPYMANLLPFYWPLRLIPPLTCGICSLSICFTWKLVSNGYCARQGILGPVSRVKLFKSCVCVCDDCSVSVETLRPSGFIRC